MCTSLGVVVTAGQRSCRPHAAATVPGLTSVTGILGARTACALPAAKPSIAARRRRGPSHGVSQRRPARQRLDPLLQGAGGEPQRSVFYQGAQWNPMDGSRQDGPGRVTTTCESGSVARCMR